MVKSVGLFKWSPFSCRLKPTALSAAMVEVARTVERLQRRIAEMEGQA